MIMSNGDRSTLRDANVKQYYTHMMPEGTHKMIRSIQIFINEYVDSICGFYFYDKDRKLLWKIGSIKSWRDVTRVELAENEVIVGVVAKLLYKHYHQSAYSDFQFLISR